MKKNKINIMIIGDGEVGKTSILSKFDNRQFSKGHVRTVGLDQVRTVYKTEDGKEELEVKLWDTAG